MIKLKKKSLFVLMAAVLMSTGCVYNHPEPTEIKEELNKALDSDNLDVPEDVLNELNPSAPAGGTFGTKVQNRLSISANDIPAAEFFGQVMMQSGLSVVVHPEVEGSISLNLDNVTPDEVFDAVYKIYGYKVEKKGNVYYVYPSGVHTETIPLNYLFIKRASQTELSIANNTVVSEGGSSSSGSSDSSSDSDSSSSSSSNNSNSSGSSSGDSYSGTSVVTTSNSDFWTELQNTLIGIMGKGEGRMVSVSPQASSITVRGMPSEIEAVRSYVRNMEASLNRQVIIEAKLLEVKLSENYEQGINWQMIFDDRISSVMNYAPWAGTSDSVFSSLGGGVHFTLKSRNGDYSSIVNLLQTQGDVSTLSSPRITTLNNQRAVMKIGKDRYFITDISTDSSTTSSSEKNVISSDYEFKPFFSGVSLDVLPQISEDGKVLLHIHPAVVEVTEDSKVVSNGDTVAEYPFATSDIRETDVVVEAKSGEIIVIGGLMKHNKVNMESKVPLLGDIPWLGEIFKNKMVRDEKTELVILIRPIVAGGETWKDEIRKSSELLQKWYPDSSENNQEDHNNNI